MAALDLSALTRVPDLGRAPQRVVSLVPSMTESLFTLGFGASVAGVTDFCTHPAEQVSKLPKVGGPKNPDKGKVLSLKPDLVFANQEENTEQAVRGLAEAGLQIWLTFPRNLQEALNVLRGLLAVYHTDAPAMQVNALQAAVDWARGAAQDQPRVKYFCPVWQGEEGGEIWWMTFNRETYAHDLLATLGGENVFADRERRYPLAADLGRAEPEAMAGRDTRYPRVTTQEVLAAAPELILLPSEPFAFEEAQGKVVTGLLADTPAVKSGRVFLVDGSLITWHGTRLAKALQELPLLFQ